ncbi:MAG TPA: histidine--tRNA ligase [Candidatus Nanoarchaeia archaeon]|nr:histidine--tRNA ligase [Candidatus Nanoarchaeia archaeon]
MPIEKVKGFRDIFPPQSLRREKIMRIIQDKAKLYGFVPIETPTIEYEELLKGDNESDEAVSDRFRLKDRGGRDLGLRFEWTFQLSRIFKENPTIKLPWRRYQTGNVFRDEPLRPDRFREFVQCDADIMGDPSVKADAECLAFANAVLKELKLTAEIYVNNRKLLDAILKEAGVKGNQLQVLREIDKLDKLSENEVKANLKKVIDSTSMENIFMLLKKDLAYFTKNSFAGADEIVELEELGKNYGFSIKFVPTLMRGFSYYTGNVFELWSKEKRAALMGGGRFDDKVGKYAGRAIPAVGISFGTLVDLECIDVDDEKNNIVIISLGQDAEAIKIAEGLRKENVACVVFYGKPSKALEYANAYAVKYAIFVGDDEVKSGKVKVKDLVSGKEELMNSKDIIKKLKKK